MTYSDLLKSLIRVTHLKSKDISSDLHYDSSYVSKWLNGHYLPSLSQRDVVNSYLATRFSNIIYRQHLQEELYPYIPDHLDLGSEIILKKTIYSALNTAYINNYESINGNPLIPEESTRIYLGLEEIQQFLFTLYSQSPGSESVSLYYHINAHYLLKIFKDFKNLLVFSNDTLVNLHLILDHPEIFFESDAFYDTYTFLAEMAFYDINIYAKHSPANSSEFIYVKDHFVLFFSMDQDGYPIVCSYVEDAAILEKIDRYLHSLDLYQHVLLQTIDDPYFEEDFFRNNNVHGENIQVFLSSFDTCFIDDRLLKRILKHNHIKNDARSALHNTLKLKAATFDEGNITITINTMPFMRSLREQKLSIGSYILEMDPMNMQSVMELADRRLENMTNIQFYMLDPSTSETNHWDYTLSFYITEHVFVAKKLDTQRKRRYKYIVSSNPRFVGQLFKTFELLYNSSYIKRVTPTYFRDRLLSVYRSIELLELGKH